MVLFLDGQHVRASGYRVLRAACAVCLLMLARPESASAQWISYSSNPRNILEGSWQSCPDATGRFAERVYDHVVNGVGQFEVHLGPKREFAIFRGVQEEHRPHDSTDNLLQPYRVPLEGMSARRRWDVPSLRLAFTVTLGGGSNSDCESWYVLLEPLQKTSH